VQGREVLNTYFAGVYPFDHPRYAIVVMRENGTSGAADCCPVFRRIVSSLP
jgi:peptidoglycan glycosyltransferase